MPYSAHNIFREIEREIMLMASDAMAEGPGNDDREVVEFVGDIYGQPRAT